MSLHWKLKRIASLLLSAVLLTACGAPTALTATPLPGASPRALGWLAFDANRGGIAQVYLMNVGETLAGTPNAGLRRLSDSEDDGYLRAWSPDGARLLFVTEYRENNEIYLAKTDGFGQLRLTTNPLANEDAPVWSPDGKKIAFVSDRDGNKEIYLMNANGSEQTNLTRNPALDGDPAWSPDGRQIAFISDRGGHSEIYLMKADGSEPKPLTHNGRNNLHPKWSPDGKKIAFVSEQNYIGDIFIVDVARALAGEAGAEANLTNDPAHYDQLPTWSPDSQTLVFVSDRDGNLEIYSMKGTDGSALKRLTNSPGYDADPAWSPDGTKIAFVSERSGDRQIYLMNPDGSDQIPLTHDPGGSFSPMWQP